MLIGRRFAARPFTQNVCINQSYRNSILLAIRFWQGGGTLVTSDIPLVIGPPQAGGTPTWAQNKSQGPAIVYGNAKYNYLTSGSPGTPTDPMILGRNAYTIGIKLYVNSIGTDHIAYCETGGGNGLMSAGRVNTNNTFGFGRYTLTNGVELASVSTAKAKQPYWVFSTFDAHNVITATASMRLYVDGVLEASSNVAILDGRAASFGIIGAYIVSGSTSPPFDGGLEFFGLWSRALSPEEIALVTETDGGILYDRVGGQFFSLAGGQAIPNAVGTGNETFGPMTEAGAGEFTPNSTGAGNETFGPMTEVGEGTFSTLVASCDVSALLAIDPCKVALGEFIGALVKTQLLCNWKARISGDETPVTCDINELIAQGKCFEGLTLFELKVAQTQLLCDIYNIIAGTPDIGCDLQTLLTEAKCIMALPPFIVKAIQTQLLCNIVQIVTPVVPSIIWHGGDNPNPPCTDPLLTLVVISAYAWGFNEEDNPNDTLTDEQLADTVIILNAEVQNAIDELGPGFTVVSKSSPFWSWDGAETTHKSALIKIASGNLVPGVPPGEGTILFNGSYFAAQQVCYQAD